MNNNFQEFDNDIFKYFKDEIISHNLYSGEIILDINLIKMKSNDLKNLIFSFFEFNKINAELVRVQKENLDFNKLEITKNEAIKSISYGLSVKTNYTVIGYEFSSHDANRYAYSVIDFFDDPKFYTINFSIWKKFDVDDFCLPGGAIIVDFTKIGIFWINDFYSFRL